MRLDIAKETQKALESRGVVARIHYTPRKNVWGIAWLDNDSGKWVIMHYLKQILEYWHIKTN
jgi:hypothetical protein